MNLQHLPGLLVAAMASVLIGSAIFLAPVDSNSPRPEANVQLVAADQEESPSDQEEPDPNECKKEFFDPADPPVILHQIDDELTRIAECWEEMLPVKDADNNVVLAMPGTNRGEHDLDERPVLPLYSDNVKEDKPFPPEHDEDIDSFLDKRTSDSTGGVTDRKNRYLGKPPVNVNQDTHEVDGKPAFKSWSDHPGVQSRPHRSQHYRLNVDNTDFVPLPSSDDPKKTDRDYRRALANNLPGTYYTTANKKKQRFPSLPKIYARDNIFVTYIKTASGMYPKVDPFLHPPGTNMLPTIYQNMRDRKNNVMPNTLPSHPNNPYNLHDGPPQVERLKTLNSPADDLKLILDEMFELLTDIPARRLWERLDKVTLEELLEKGEDHEQKIRRHRELLEGLAKWGVDLIEGIDGDNSNVPSNRAYRGFALLNHSGHKYRNKRAIPIYGNDGKIVSANIDVHQIWYGGRIQSDTMFFDFGWDDEPLFVKTSRGVEKRWYSTYDANWDWGLLKRASAGGKQDENGHVSEADLVNLTANPAPIPPDVPWTVTYTIDVLNRGEDDFSPTQVYFDEMELIKGTSKVPAYRVFDPATGKNQMVRMGPPHIAMDQTFFPMQQGTRTRLKLKMAPPRYCNVTYTWGWRNHPPRAQAVENSHKRIPPGGPELVGHYKVVANHPSWPQLPPFARLRISDHERFTFGGINVNPTDPVPGVPTVDDEVERYFPERRPGLVAKYGEDLSVDELKAKLKEDVFKKLACKVPFFHPIVTDPNHPKYKVEQGPISRIGDLAPAKRMWRAFREMKAALELPGENEENHQKATTYYECIRQILDAQDAYLDWMDRNHLPSGLRPDPNSDFTILYVNNTIYGESVHGGLNFDEWVTRSDNPDGKEKQLCDLKLTILNGDYFLHGYINPDFGGSRGWENQFKPTLALGGSGSFFTFGRFSWRFNSEPGAVAIPPAVRVNDQDKDIVHALEPNQKPGILSKDGEPIYDGRLPHGVRLFAHRVWIRYNFEPSRRLRFYQFDPLHHDAAIYSIH